MELEPQQYLADLAERMQRSHPFPPSVPLDAGPQTPQPANIFSVDPHLAALLSRRTFGPCFLRLAIAPLKQDIPPVEALLRGEAGPMGAITSVFYSLTVFLRFFAFNRDGNLTEAVMESHSHHWTKTLPWCHFASQLIPHLPARAGHPVMSVVAHFIRGCLERRSSLLTLPGTVELCVELWVARSLSGQHFSFDNPARTDGSYCPILDAVYLCVRDATAHRVFLRYAECHEYQALVAKRVVDRLISLARCSEASGARWPNLDWTSRVINVLIQIGHPWISRGCLSPFMTRVKYFKHLSIALDRLVNWGFREDHMLINGRRGGDRETFSRTAFRLFRDIVWGILADNPRRLAHLVQVISGGAFNILLSQFRSDIPTSHCTILRGQGIEAATAILLNSSYHPVSSAINLAFNRIPQSTHPSVRTHSIQGRELISRLEQLGGLKLQAPRFCRSTSNRIRVCNNSACDGTASANAAARVCSKCHAIMYCSKKCQAEDWRDLHRQECEIRSEKYRRSKQNPDYQVNMRYVTHLAETLEDLCNERFMDTATAEGMPCGIFVIDMLRLPMGFRMVSVDEYAHSFGPAPGAIYYDGQITAAHRTRAYLDECSQKPDTVRFACGMFLWGGRMSVGILARLRYEEEPAPGHRLKFRLLGMIVSYSALPLTPPAHDKCSSSCLSSKP